MIEYLLIDIEAQLMRIAWFIVVSNSFIAGMIISASLIISSAIRSLKDEDE